MRSLRFLDDQVEHAGSRRARQRCRRACDVSGVEFIEFAANEEEANRSADVRRARVHADGDASPKDVTRWKQGGINFVINSEPDSFARAYDSVHGASVCALGLSVDNVDAAMERAQTLQIQRFSQAVGPRRAADPIGPGRRRQPGLFHRGGEESERVGA